MNAVYTEKQISRVLIHLVQDVNVLSADTEQSFTLGIAALMAGEMAVWMGPGRRFIEISWEVCILE